VPFLRVIRDKRGYETTYLMHWYREGHRQGLSILYVFRTPGGVRVGREALEPDVLRSIETEYPAIDFDWKTVFDTKQVVEPVPERRPRKRRGVEEEGDVAAASDEARARAPVEPSASPPRPKIPSALEGATPNEQIAFLATWYPIVRARVPQRTADPVRREALLALSERLNTTTWTDADQITTGLQQAAEAIERLSRVFSKRRRRACRPPKTSPTPPESQPTTHPEDPPPDDAAEPSSEG
jgi:hypothetical protein